MLTATKKMTVEEFEDYAATHGRCELIRGEVRHMSPASIRHGIIAARWLSLIDRFIGPRDLGIVLAAETGFVTEPEPDGPSVRAPDVAYVHKDRLPTLNQVGFGKIPPDLCCEVLSPSDRAGETQRRIQDWLDFGVRLVWVADPDTQTVTAYEPGGHARVYHEHESLPGGEVLPGFELPLRELFR